MEQGSKGKVINQLSLHKMMMKCCGPFSLSPSGSVIFGG